MTSDEFISHATRLRELGAIEVAAGDLFVRFEPPKVAMQLAPRAPREPQPIESEPETRAAFRDRVKGALAHG